MLRNKLKAFGNQIIEGYKSLEHYFTDGSFGVKFYPFLMHPCVRNTQSTFIRLFSVLAVFCGLYYFFAELIVILFSEASLAAYFSHTTLELLIPLHSVIDDRKSTLSPLSETMQTVYMLQSWLFVFIYFICVTQITERKLRLLAALSAILFAIGVSLIYSTQGGKYTVGGLHNIGFEATFLVGNLVMILSGLAMNRASLKRFKHYSLLAGMIGGVAIAIPLFIENPFTPILERLSIYLFLVWEIALGFAVLREMK